MGEQGLRYALNKTPQEIDSEGELLTRAEVPTHLCLCSLYLTALSCSIRTWRMLQLMHKLFQLSQSSAE